VIKLYYNDTWKLLVVPVAAQLPTQNPPLLAGGTAVVLDYQDYRKPTAVRIVGLQ
jgi:hypothetical protein